MTQTEIKGIRNLILKPLMLAIIYGKGAASIARDVPCSYRDAVDHLNNFARAYPRIFAWLHSYVAQSMERGWAENIIGFRAAFNVVDPAERGHIARSCQNFPIQSSAAACFQLTGLHLADFGADIRLPLHDAYLINVPNDPKAIAEAIGWVDSATTAATNQLFPGLAVKLEKEVLRCFAKDGKTDSFASWVSALERDLCGAK
jgi:DNA polymerase I-like protein with 3'-5' exonuclease and polymerase domains